MRPDFQSPRALRAAFFAGVAVTALFAAAPAAFAADKPATEEGAQDILDFFETYLGKQAVTPKPAPIAVKANDDSYALTIDLGAINNLAKSAGFSYEPAKLAYTLAQQDDGLWRMTNDGMPRIVSHGPNSASSVMQIDNFKAVTLIDPAISWLRTGKASADKGVFEVHQPGVDEIINFGAVSANFATTDGAAGAVSTSGDEEIDAIDFKAAPGPNGETRPSVSGHVDKTKVNLSIGGLKASKALDLWAFAVAHPTRPDAAAHEDELKGLIKEVVTSDLAFSEGVAAEKLVIETPMGAVVLAAAKAGFGLAAGGANAGLDYHIAADGLSLPASLAPPNAKDLVPKSFDVAFKIGGVNVPAGMDAALAAFHLEGDGPPISDADRDKVMAAFMGGAPMTVDIAPSHINAPALDVDFSGSMQYLGPKPSGTMTIHMRNFDKTLAALKALGPDVEKQAGPALAMAKGLAKTESDGTLTWVAELAGDGAIKVNGLPLGKAPI